MVTNGVNGRVLDMDSVPHSAVLQIEKCKDTIKVLKKNIDIFILNLGIKSRAKSSKSTTISYILHKQEFGGKKKQNKKTIFFVKYIDMIYR